MVVFSIIEFVGMICAFYLGYVIGKSDGGYFV